MEENGNNMVASNGGVSKAGQSRRYFVGVQREISQQTGCVSGRMLVAGTTILRACD